MKNETIRSTHYNLQPGDLLCDHAEGFKLIVSSVEESIAFVWVKPATSVCQVEIRLRLLG